jgi:hypothetical protein
VNYEPSSLREWGASPRELFLGRKADAKQDFRCAFGDFVQCTVPSTDNTMRARTEDAVVLLPTGNRTGSVRVFSLGTGKIITRDHFQILPMPVLVISVLNKLAASDGITLGPMTGVLNHTIRNYEPIVSHLPTYFTPPHHAAEDPTTTEQDRSYAETELADEAGLELDGPVGHDEAGVYHVTPTTTLTTLASSSAQPTQPTLKPKRTARDTPGVPEMRVGGDIGGGGQEIGGDTGVTAEHGYGDDTGGAAYESGGEPLRDDVALRGTAQDQPVAPSPTPRSPAGARLLDFFRRGGTDLTLMSREIIECLGDAAESPMNITVMDAIRTGGAVGGAFLNVEMETGVLVHMRLVSPMY